VDWLQHFFGSSIGKKVLMGCSGLLLVVFCIFHLGGNFLMCVSPETYNNYAHTLHSQEWAIKIAEAGLVLLFVVHIFLALTTDRDNREARPVGYAVTQTNRKDRFLPAMLSADNTMFLSGVIILVFLIWHLSDFVFEFHLTEVIAGKSPFEKAMIILQNPTSAAIYVIGTLVLGWHLSHGIASAFRTLGWNHPKYMQMINGLTIFLSLFIGLGFASFPLWANLFQVKRPTEVQQPDKAEPTVHTPVHNPAHTMTPHTTPVKPVEHNVPNEPAVTATK
jgi:succinate dehydrogenase / fumarate reductase cytochrome b subunit